MIAEHQPSIFPHTKLLTALSSIDDGNMRFRIAGGDDDATVTENRRNFLQKIGHSINDTGLVYVTYDTDHFTRFRVARRGTIGAGMEAHAGTEPADGLLTTEKGLALFLPLADCNGVILYDEPRHAVMVVHLGRHSTIEDGARKAVEFMRQQIGTDPRDILAWLSPTVGKDSYAMEAKPTDPRHFHFADDPRWRNFRAVKGDKVFIDISGYNRNGLIEAGVVPQRIEVSPIDTAKDDRYPSYSSHSSDPGRFAIVAALR